MGGRVMNSNEDDRKRLKINDPNAIINIPGSKKLATDVDLFDDHLRIAAATGIPLPKQWDNISGIHRSRGMRLDKPEKFVFVVEKPLYSAVRMLDQAGITTTESNAHFSPGQEETLIMLGIMWDTLNEEQKRIAVDLCKQEPDKWKHITADKHPDKYEALYLHWNIKKTETGPRQVKSYVDSSVQRLIKGRLLIKVGQR
jgi:hypothetical protein